MREFSKVKLEKPVVEVIVPVKAA